MNKSGWYTILALFTVISLAVTLPGCVKVNTGAKTSQLISDATLAAAVDSDSRPVNPANTFPVSTENIFLSLKLNNAPANTQVTGKLTYVGGEATSMANTTLFHQSLTGQGTRYLSFAIKPPPGGFPQGNYLASLSAGGQELASLPFTVQNLAAPKSGPVISKFTAIPDTIAAGQTVTLTWDTSNTTRVTLQPEVGTLPASGTRTITPSTTTTYNLIASNDTGATTSQTTVRVGQALAGAPDLIITELWLEVCTIYYRVKNTGASDSTPTYTYLYVDNMFPPLGGTSFVDKLKPGEERGLQFSSYQWPWCSPGAMPLGGGGGGGPTGQVMYPQGTPGGNFNPGPYATHYQNDTPPPQTHNPPDSGGGGYMDFSSMNHMIKACADGKNELTEADKNNNCMSKIYGILFKYDLLPQGHQATWLTNIGPAEYYTTEGTTTGAHFKMSDGSLQVIPPRSPNSFIQGYFGYFFTTTPGLGYVDTGPTATAVMPIMIPPKLKFIGRVGLAQNATGTDGVTFKLGLKGLNDVTNFVGSKTMTQPGVFEDWVVDLKDYEGQVAYFILRTEAGASPNNDFAIWKEGRLEQFE
jgi:hypothetical protein